MCVKLLSTKQDAKCSRKDDSVKAVSKNVSSSSESDEKEEDSPVTASFTTLILIELSRSTIDGPEISCVLQISCKNLYR